MDIRQQIAIAERRNELGMIEILADCEDAPGEIVDYECYDASEDEDG